MMFDLRMYHETKDNEGRTVEIPMQVGQINSLRSCTSVPVWHVFLWSMAMA
jgi:hypothetical protein